MIAERNEANSLIISFAKAYGMFSPKSATSYLGEGKLGDEAGCRIREKNGDLRCVIEKGEDAMIEDTMRRKGAVSGRRSF